MIDLLGLLGPASGCSLSSIMSAGCNGGVGLIMFSSNESRRLSSISPRSVVKDSRRLVSPECSNISLASARCSPPSVLPPLIVEPALSTDAGDPIESCETR